MFDWIKRYLIGKEAVSEQETPLKYDCIPKHSERGLGYRSYPQIQGMPLVAQSPSFFCRRYADEMRQLLDALPLSEEEINRLIMPVLGKLIQIVNILPASEYNHHAGNGGLWLHSLQCASAALTFCESMEFEKTGSQEERYHNQQRWIIAGVIVGLLHDIGKIYDIVVITEDNNQWNPFTESLLEWAKRNRVKQFFVVWKDDRVHKRHELRSVRLMYLSLMHEDLIRYLTEVTGDEILGAIDDAIAMDSGPLSAVLRKAETCSIKQDSGARKRLGAGAVFNTAPLLSVILQAVNALLLDGIWTINKKNSRIFVIAEGLFMVLTDHAAREIHDKACGFHAPYVPSTAMGIAQVLADSEEIKFLKIDLGGELGLCNHCLKINDTARILHGVPIPDALPGRILPEENKPTEQFMAPKTDFTSVAQGTRGHGCDREKENGTNISGSEQGDLLTEEKVYALCRSKLSAVEVKDFADRLIATLCVQMQSGGGFLVENLRTSKDGEMICSSSKVEEFLEMLNIHDKSQELLFRIKRNLPTVLFDWEKHQLQLVRKSSED